MRWCDDSSVLAGEESETCGPGMVGLNYGDEECANEIEDGNRDHLLSVPFDHVNLPFFLRRRIPSIREKSTRVKPFQLALTELHWQSR